VSAVWFLVASFGSELADVVEDGRLLLCSTASVFIFALPRSTIGVLCCAVLCCAVSCRVATYHTLLADNQSVFPKRQILTQASLLPSVPLSQMKTTDSPKPSPKQRTREISLPNEENTFSADSTTFQELLLPVMESSNFVLLEKHHKIRNLTSPRRSNSKRRDR